MRADVSVDGGRIASVSNLHEADALPLGGKLLIPGLVDVHVHLREPGFFYKETIETRHAGRGARRLYGACAPCPTSILCRTALEHLDGAAGRDPRGTRRCSVSPYGAHHAWASTGEANCADLEAHRPHIVAGFSDDGRGVQAEGHACARPCAAPKALGKVDRRPLRGRTACFTAAASTTGDYAAAARPHGHLLARANGGRWSATCAWRRKPAAAYHVCHVSTKESVALIRAGQGAGRGRNLRDGAALPAAVR